MQEPPPGYRTVFKTSQRNECMELRLVLEAAGIRVESGYHDETWSLIVPEDVAAISEDELAAYRRENPAGPVAPIRRVTTYGGAVPGIYVYGAMIALVFVLTATSAFGLEWLTVGRMQAGQVTSGEWWRVVTALTLHLDVEHLVGNLVFGAVFGILAGQLFGGGVAWLAIVIAGAFGNFINAWAQSPSHSSIGASTAVFAALGLLVAHSLRHRSTEPEKPLRRWSPLVGGILLLAYTGVGGERTDVLAHVTGFLSGLLIGWVGSRLPSHWLSDRRVQTAAGLAAITLVVAAWMVGFAVSG